MTMREAVVAHMRKRMTLMTLVILVAGVRTAAGQEVLLYAAESGLGATGRVNQIDGTFTPQIAYSDFRAGWTHIASSQTGRILFYDSATGRGATGFQDQQGTFTTLQELRGLSIGWTHVAWAGHASDFSFDYFLFYNANTGAGAAGSVDASGRFTNLRQLGFLPGWTHIAADPFGDELLFYNANTGEGATGFLFGTVDFVEFVQQQTFDTFSTDWTYIGPADFFSNTLFFYNAVTGHAAIGRIRLADGQFVNLREYDGFSPGWTAIGLAGNILLFYNTDDGSTATGEFYDAQLDFRTLQFDSVGRSWTHMVAVQRM